MRIASCVVTFLIMSSSMIAQSEKWVPRTELIPFADESEVSKLDMDESGGRWFGDETETLIDDRLVIRSKGVSLARHLVTSHDCPQWIADYYQNDVKLLVRIHKGYELQGVIKRAKEDLERHEKIKRGDPEYKNFSKFPELGSYYRNDIKSAQGKFKMLKVTEPEPTQRTLTTANQ